MTAPIRCLVLLSVATLLGGCKGEPELLQGEGLIVLSGVTVIDGSGRAPVENAVVVIRDGEVYRVAKVGDFRYPTDATLLPVAGRYVIPGLMDLHAHARGYMMNTLLAFGITTIRNPGNRLEPWEELDPPLLGIALRDRVAQGDLQGPRMFSAGPLIDVPDGLFAGEIGQVRDEAEIREEVRRQASAGVDYVKLYMGVTDTMAASAIEEAFERQVRVLGHLRGLSWTRAAELGMHGILHSCSEGPTWELIPSETERFPSDDWGSSLKAWAVTAGRLNLTSPAFDRLVDLLVQNQVEVNPTLVTLEALYWADDSKHLEEMAPSWVPLRFTARWSVNWETNRNFMAQWQLTADEWLQLKLAFSECQRMVRELHERGVLLTAGSDVGTWMTPGLSLHRELQLLAATGISPIDVIRIATSNGAKALDISEEVGTLEAGKVADLIVLREDPLTDIRNTLSIDIVIHRGVVLHPAELLAQDQEYSMAPRSTGSGGLASR